MFDWLNAYQPDAAPFAQILPCAPARDLTGRHFGKLTVEHGPMRKYGRSAWWCKCECGVHKLIRDASLRAGVSRSCGCAQRAHAVMLGRAHKVHGGTGTRLYSIWHGMVQRCEYVRHKGFPDYGARGITVCAEWRQDFAAFRAWAESHGYSPDLTLDRINPDGNYAPGNCRWASWSEQARNKRGYRARSVERGYIARSVACEPN